MTPTPLAVKLLKYIPVVFLLFTGACGEETTPAETPEVVQEEEDSLRNNLLSVDGAVFSIPSPIQTSMLLKQSGANYNKELLNDPLNYSRYVTKFKKAMNLGVYGADLGYVTMYDQTQDALGYLGAVRKMAEDLGVAGAFDMGLVTRFEQNMGNRDSMLAMVADAYRASDNYLKNNEDDQHWGVLIIAGGWIESLYFATHVASETNNPELIRRVGEQKKSLENLIKLLGPFYSESSFSPVVDNLIDLHNEFNQIKYTYVYEKPTVDPATKTTTINSRSDISLSEQQLETITQKVRAIRNQIVG